MENVNDGAPVERPFPGTAPIGEMTDRQIAEETLYWLRTAGQTLAELQKGGVGGMMKMMMSGGR